MSSLLIIHHSEEIDKRIGKYFLPTLGFAPFPFGISREIVENQQVDRQTVDMLQ